MKMLMMTCALVLVLPVCVPATAFAQPTSDKESPSAVLQEKLAQAESERRELARLLAPIKSRADLDKHLATVLDSPINRLSPAAKWRFIDGLVFSERGLGSYRYDVLEAELTPTEIYHVLSLFGVQHTTRMLTHARRVSPTDDMIMAMEFTADPVDHENFWCSSRATCSPQTLSICIGGNC